MTNSEDKFVPSATDRLSFRYLIPGDALKWKSFVTSDEAMRYFPFPREKSESLAWIERQIKRYESGTGGLLAVCDLESGELLGQCGLLKQDLNGEEVWEVGYSFLPEHWGNGYATEAAGCFYRHGFRLNLADFLVSIIHVDNKASRLVAQKNGLYLWKTMEWKGYPVEVWRINNPKAHNS